MQNFTDNDWKLFRNKIGDWQEKYMGTLIKEYTAILNGTGEPSEKFWALDKRIREDKKSSGVQIRLAKSEMIANIVSFINEGVICMDDLEDFSDELLETVAFICANRI
ncbi:MAG: multidrug transporter [Clostridia bacterium]|nr:multidrug transporter [Clostridia bacterium]